MALVDVQMFCGVAPAAAVVVQRQSGVVETIQREGICVTALAPEPT